MSTLQEQADAILARTDADSEVDALLKLMQDRDALLSVLNSVNECLVANGSIDSDTPIHHRIEATIQQAERPR